MAMQLESRIVRLNAVGNTAERVHRTLITAMLILGIARAAQAEVVSVDSAVLTISQGELISLIFRLDENTTPLLGYSLDIDILPEMDAVGAIKSDVMATNFFDSENLISAAGLARDPLFSQIVDTGDGGVFITTNTEDLSTVIATTGVNDALAEVVFRAPDNALGRFRIDLGPASFLSDGNVNPVAFDYEPITLNVIPEPLSSIFYGLVLAVFTARRRR